MIFALLSIGDRLIQNDHTQLLEGIPLAGLLWAIINSALKSIPEDERVPLMQTAIRDTNSVYFPVYALALWKHALSEDHFPRLSAAQLEQLYPAVTEKITEASHPEVFFDYYPPLSFAFRWIDWADKHDFTNWIIRHDQVVIRFIEHSVSYTRSSKALKTENGYYISQEIVASFDCKRIAKRAKELLEVMKLSTEQTILVSDFVHALDTQVSGTSATS